VLRGPLEDMLDDAGRVLLEDELLPAYVPARRWFQGKDAEFKQVRVARTAHLPGSSDQFLAEIEVETSAGSARYQLPLGIAWEDETSGPFAHNLALARVRRGRRVGLLTDAFATPEFARAMLEGLQACSEMRAGEGSLHFRCEPGFDIPLDAELEWLAAEQSNSSLRVGADAVLKLLRRTEPGIHPETEMTRELARRGYANAAPLLGEVVWNDAEGVPHTVVVVQGFIQNQGDGWSWTLGYLGRVLDEHTLETHGDEPDVEPELEAYRGFAQVLGRRLAAMHAVLAQPSDDPAFAPEPADQAHVVEWSGRVSAQLAVALDLLESRLDSLPRREPIEALLASREALAERIGDLAQAGQGQLRTRIHGDLHLGQVLVTGGDVVIIDFEGEPAKTMDARRAKDSRWRDVAGVMRSFAYAAAVATAGGQAARSEAGAERAREAMRRFIQFADKAFLEGYAEEGLEADTGLLPLFLLEKAAYEVAYEAANRPEWLHVPAYGLAAIAQHMLEGGH
jgi:maltose alpha-D-glucosyltransferase / alpha-amylase